MATTYYSWSTFRIIDPKNPDAKPATVNPGDTVTADKLGVSKEDFEEMIAGGSVRATKYPDLPEGYTGSPSDWYREQLAAAAEADYADVAEELKKVETPPAPTTTAPPAP